MAATRRNWVLLDTDVFSYYLKDSGGFAERYRPHLRSRILALSFVTVGEIYSGLYKRGVASATVSAFEARLREAVIIPYTLEMCRIYGQLVREKTAQGSDRTLAINDRWIAACAIQHGLPLVTNNARNFLGLSGLHVITEA